MGANGAECATLGTSDRREPRSGTTRVMCGVVRLQTLTRHLSHRRTRLIGTLAAGKESAIKCNCSPDASPHCTERPILVKRFPFEGRFVGRRAYSAQWFSGSLIFVVQCSSFG